MSTLGDNITKSILKRQYGKVPKKEDEDKKPTGSWSQIMAVMGYGEKKKDEDDEGK